MFGGLIQMDSAKECTVTLEVIEASDVYRFMGWTSKHCEFSANMASTPLLKIFLRDKNGSTQGAYYPLQAQLSEEALAQEVYGLLSRSDSRSAIRKNIDNGALVNMSFEANDAIFDCVSDGSLEQSFCAVLGDTVLYDLTVDKSQVPASLQTVFDLSAERAKQNDALSSGLTGVGRDAQKFSKTIEEYWFQRKMLEIAPAVDLWTLCNDESAMQSFQNEGVANGGNDVRLPTMSAPAPDGGGITTGDPDSMRYSGVTAADFNFPEASVPKTSNPFSKEGWNEVRFMLPTNADAQELQEHCAAMNSLPSILKSRMLLRRNLWKELERAKIVSGSRPSVSEGTLLYSKRVREKEREIRADLLQQWGALGPRLAGNLKDVEVYTNFKISEEDSRQTYSGFAAAPMNDTFFGNVHAEPIGTGIRFQSDRNASVQFDQVGSKPHSGTLFTFRGVFPLLTLNSVNGEGTSGGVTVVPLPQDPGMVATRQTRTDSTSSPSQLPRRSVVGEPTGNSTENSAIDIHSTDESTGAPQMPEFDWSSTLADPPDVESNPPEGIRVDASRLNCT